MIFMFLFAALSSRLKTYLTYFKSGGLSTGVLALLYAILGQALSMLADYWLRWWAEGRFGEQGNPLYKWVFAILVASTILVGYHKAHVWLNFALDASSSLHSRSLWAVLHSPMQFFGERLFSDILKIRVVYSSAEYYVMN